jgi:molybdopterin-guanine dinucleotide biosynthesis protein A
MNYDPRMDVSAFILAGGNSSRMGTDKAFLTLGGRTLLCRALELARSTGTLHEQGFPDRAPQDGPAGHEPGATVFIVGNRHRFAPYGEVIEDVFRGQGPLGGIHAALRASHSQLNLVLAVDTPFVQVEFLRYMVEQARATAALVSVPRIGGYYHPLCAVYRLAFRERAEAALQAGRNKIDPLFTPDITRVIDEAELARLSFPATMFDNLNTREDFARAQAGMKRTERG